MHKKIIVLIILFLLPFNFFAQEKITSFESKEKFISVLTELYNRETNKKSKKKVLLQLLEEFSNAWNIGTFTESQKTAIFNNSNLLLKKRARAYPHFHSYLSTLLYFTKNSVFDANSFSNWNKSLKHYIVDRSHSIILISKFLRFSIELSKNNVLYKSTSARWYTQNGNTRLLFDKEKGLTVSLKQGNLICYSKKDSLVIYNTNGTFKYVNNSWSGNKGKVTWERAGFKKNDVYATLSFYRINMRTPSYMADTVMFYNKNYFNEPQLGKLYEKILANVKPISATYPRFESKNKRIEIPEVIPGFFYVGGFTMYGSKFVGKGDQREGARLFVKKNKELFIKVISQRFLFDENHITSKNARIVFKIEKDSLYHGNILFKYNATKKTVEVMQEMTSGKLSPFYSTYHNMQIYTSVLRWKKNDTLIDFAMPVGSTHSKASFESDNYFSEREYRMIRGMDNVHPLSIINKHAANFGDEFTAKELAMQIRRPAYQVRLMLIRLSKQGFIQYNAESQEVLVLSKVRKWIKAMRKKEDYDVIKISSETMEAKNPNAILNLKNNNLIIKGAKPFVLSQNKKVVVLPKNKTITIKQNRDMSFDGRVIAGLAIINGDNFNFNYDEFNIKLDSIKSTSLTIRSTEEDTTGRIVYEYYPLKSKIEKISGVLYIDESNNKSGSKKNLKYPSLESIKKSYVYYNKVNRKNAVYGDSLYFENFPFRMDSLRSITHKSISIKGTFYSADILPVINDTLSIQKDYSLGFIRQTKKTGIEVYKGKGVFYNTINLSNNGLKGTGEIKYLTSLTRSDKFNLYPKIVNAESNYFNIDKQSKDSALVEYPSAKTKIATINWLPQKDSLTASVKVDSFIMFDNKALLKSGSLLLRPKGLLGNGIMYVADAKLVSNKFKYNLNTFKSDTSSFSLLPNEFGEISFKTDMVSANIDFTTEKGVFNSIGHASYIEFPYNKYNCYMDYFTWFMNKRQIYLGDVPTHTQDTNLIANTDSLIVDDNFENIYNDSTLYHGSRFISTHAKQDSLSFFAQSSIFAIDKQIITAKGVKIISVADSKILPSHDIIIEPDAKMQTLHHAKIITDTLGIKHNIFDSKVTIYSKYNYKGNGDYYYVDEKDERQTIHFNEIYVDKDSLITIANGSIPDSIFMLSKHHSFAGKVSLSSSNKFLSFDGSSAINHLCENRLPAYKLRFRSIIDPNKIVIPINSRQTRDIKRKKLYSTFFITNDSSHVYSSFLSQRNTYSDFSMLPAKGFLRYNKSTAMYDIGSKEKLDSLALDGNYINLSKDYCFVLGTGKINFAKKTDNIVLSSSGTIRHKLDENTVKLKVFLGIDFVFTRDALSLMAKKINSEFMLDAVDFTTSDYKKNLTEYAGIDISNEFYEDLEEGELEDIPDTLKRTIMFSDLRLEWNTGTQSFRSIGKIGIGNINGTQINKYLEGYVEIVKKRAKQVIYIYLKIDESTWFFFKYSGGIMSGISSSDKFNEKIAKDIESITKGKKRNVSDITFNLSTKKVKNEFIKNFTQKKSKITKRRNRKKKEDDEEINDEKNDDEETEEEEE